MAGSSNVVIKVENLSKQYRLGLVGSGTVRDDFARWWASVRGKENPLLKVGERNDRSVKGDSEYVWSLKDINFEVNKGEVLGIIGRNGAGKSTLLKILSKVTGPTQGQVKVKGRIASLLEVGTGFHPELTGRENIYLNGAILGMKRSEITRKFDEIVSFSGVERYVDTPVKRYSSGMYVRLAFAVAAHLEPEILIIDEVLAVGDAEFQKKCLGKMKDVSDKEGRTVLFVSHNMSAVNTLCTRGLMLKNGGVYKVGDTNEVVRTYLNDFTVFNNKIGEGEYDNGDAYVRLISARLINARHEDVDYVTVSDKFGIEINYEVLQGGYKPGPNFLLSTQDGEKVFQSLHPHINDYQQPGRYSSVAWFEPNTLNDIGYKLTVCVTTHNPVKIHVSANINFTVYDDLSSLTRGDYMGQMHGLMRPMLKWELKKV